MKLLAFGLATVVSSFALTWLLGRRDHTFGADLTHQRAHEAWTGRKWGEPASLDEDAERELRGVKR